jgi:hypothetical protein
MLYVSHKYTQRANCIFWVLKCIHGTYRHSLIDRELGFGPIDWARCTYAKTGPLCQTLPDLHNSYVLKGLTPSHILRKSELSMDMVQNVCIHTAVHLKSELQHTGTWQAAAWPPVHQCYRTASILPPPLWHCTSILTKKFDVGLKKCYFYFLKLCNLKLRKSGTVCAVTTVL